MILKTRRNEALLVQELQISAITLQIHYVIAPSQDIICSGFLDQYRKTWIQSAHIQQQPACPLTRASAFPPDHGLKSRARHTTSILTKELGPRFTMHQDTLMVFKNEKQGSSPSVNCSFTSMVSGLELNCSRSIISAQDYDFEVTSDISDYRNSPSLHRKQVGSKVGKTS